MYTLQNPLHEGLICAEKALALLSNARGFCNGKAARKDELMQSQPREYWALGI